MIDSLVCVCVAVKHRSAGVFVVCIQLLRVLQLMNLTDSRLAQAGNERLELAMLSFFEQFRKIYIGDQVQKSSKVNESNRSTVWNETGAWPRWTSFLFMGVGWGASRWELVALLS